MDNPNIPDDKAIILGKWEILKTKLDEIKLAEMEARKAVTEAFFPNAVKGTQRQPLANGWALKFVHGYNYKLGDSDKINPDTGAKVRIDDQIFALQSEIEKMGEVAEHIIDRCIKWSPDLSVTEYQKLDLNDPIQKLIKSKIDDVLTISDKAPVLELEAPKVK